MRDLLAEFLRGFSLRTLIFLLDMVLPQLDAYHVERHLQHLQPWVSVELMQQQLRRQTGTRMQVTYQYEAHAGFHVMYWGGPFSRACFFIRCEDQKRAPSLSYLYVVCDKKGSLLLGCDLGKVPD